MKHNHDADREYVELVGHIKKYADEHGSDLANRAVADALEDVLEQWFSSESYNRGELTKSSGTACIGRVIDGGRCTHRGRSANPDGAPHDAPHRDHADLWLHDGEPYAYTMHLYDVYHDTLTDVVEFAEEYGLKVHIRPGSWYFPNQTTCIVFTNPDVIGE